MSRVYKIFQTLEQRYNQDDIERNGPFQCTHDSSWAFSGFYFWEHHYELAKFWGETVYKSKSKDYVICKSEYELNDDLCYDYEGNPYKRDEFFEIINDLKDNGVIRENDTLHNILKYLRINRIMLHDAFRFVGNPTMSTQNEFYESVIIKRKAKKDVELPKIREVQIVFFEKFACNRRGFEIVFESDLGYV